MWAAVSPTPFYFEVLAATWLCHRQTSVCLGGQRAAWSPARWKSDSFANICSSQILPITIFTKKTPNPTIQKSLLPLCLLPTQALGDGKPAIPQADLAAEQRPKEEDQSDLLQTQPKPCSAPCSQTAVGTGRPTAWCSPFHRSLWFQHRLVLVAVQQCQRLNPSEVPWQLLTSPNLHHYVQTGSGCS